MIKDITQAKESWRIQGRIIYSWEQGWGDIDFIIRDSQGTEIQATIAAKRLFFKYKSLVREGDLRFITNFSFASFNDILLKNLDARYLVDIIGELHAKGPIENTSKDKRTMLIELIDCEGQKLILTLWEKLADQMASSTTEFDKSEHRPIVIIRYAKIKVFQDSNVSNSLCSKILMDAEIPEVRNFIKRKIEVGLKPSSSSSTILTSYCESVVNELLDLPTRRTINEIREIQEVYQITI
ncbi:uncharacterized protein LOC141587883 [Silene latifolia]|uniref:uncharacterized protein LOC141587883 n=1 Tax=Silene latifolia TaxID=37657 RepID=UPI003D77E2FE